VKKLNWPVIAVLLTCGGILIAKIGSCLPFISDDAFISLRYAKRLIAGDGLTWTAGQRVEGYSNLLWVLTLSTLGRLGLDLVVAARLLGATCMLGILVTVAIHQARRYPTSIAALSSAAGLVFLAFSGPMAVWAIGGLEPPLYGLLLAIAIALMPAVADRPADALRPALWLSLPLGLMCLTRPDGPLFTGAAAASLLLSGWLDKKPRPLLHSMTVLVFPALLTGAQLVFRLAYYGEWIPNTALVKVALSSTRRTFGYDYLWSGIGAFWPFSAIAVAGLLAMIVIRRTRAQGLFLTATALAWSIYVVFVGGDVFPAYRHLIPLIVIFAFAISEGTAIFAERAKAQAAYSLVGVAAAIVLAVGPYVRVQASDKWIRRASTERWEWQAKDLAEVLKTAFQAKQPLVAVTAAGALPYFSDLPSLDMMGLNDYYLPRHRPATFGRGMVGHELGDGRYVLDRQPDVIVFDVGSPTPSWRTGEELNAMPEFREFYVPARTRVASIPDGAFLFIRKYSERVGIEARGTSTTAPGYLFTGPDTVADISGGQLIARIEGPRPAQLIISLHGDLPLVVDVESSRVQNVEVTVAQQGGALTITVTPKAGGASIERVVLKPR